jgi:peroxiredoxin-like protein
MSRQTREEDVSTSQEYESSMEWTGGKEGRAEARGLPTLDVASPPEFGGPGGRWSPEHLFVASANVCVLLTFVAIADFSKLAFRNAGSSAKGTLEKVEGEGFQFTGIDVHLKIEIENETDVARAERIVQKAEAACLVSKSMKTPVRVTADITSGG